MGRATGLTIATPPMLPPDGNEVLPEYAQPPVVEVALAIEFEQPVGLRSLHLGRLADAWGDGWLPEERSLLPPMDPSSEDDDQLDSLPERTARHCGSAAAVVVAERCR